MGTKVSLREQGRFTQNTNHKRHERTWGRMNGHLSVQMQMSPSSALLSEAV